MVANSARPVKERVFDFVQSRCTAPTWGDGSVGSVGTGAASSASRLDVSDAYLVAWYTRAHVILQRLLEDGSLWTEFGIGVADLRPARERRKAADALEKSLWGWMRAHREFLGL